MGRTRVERQVYLRRHIDIAEPVIAVNACRPSDMRPAGIERLADALGDRCGNIPCPFEEQRIARRRLDRGIAEDRGDADQLAG